MRATHLEQIAHEYEKSTEEQKLMREGIEKKVNVSYMYIPYIVGNFRGYQFCERGENLGFQNLCPYCIFHSFNVCKCLSARESLVKSTYVDACTCMYVSLAFVTFCFNDYRRCAQDYLNGEPVKAWLGIHLNVNLIACALIEF